MQASYSPEHRRKSDHSESFLLYHVGKATNITQIIYDGNMKYLHGIGNCLIFVEFRYKMIHLSNSVTGSDFPLIYHLAHSFFLFLFLLYSVHKRKHFKVNYCFNNNKIS